MTRTAYLFSGLGADERVFDQLNLHIDQKRCIKWVSSKNGEGLTEYAQRIVDEQFGISDNESIILVGVSFGGIVTREVSKIIDFEKLILISSIKTRHEIPRIYRIAGFLKLHFWIPANFLKSANFLNYRLFGVKNREQKLVLKSILKDTDSHFLKWAMNEIVNWENESVSEKTTHIHGTDDHIIPVRFVKNAIKILGGGHLMILTHSQELDSIINDQLK